MGDHSKIEWTEATWNPVVGCDIVSPGCRNCYAMRDAYRKGFNPKLPRYHGLTRMTKAGPVWTSEVRTVPELLDWPLRKRDPLHIFVNSMSDLFYGDEEDRRRCEQRGTPFHPVPFQFIADVFAVMACTTRHTYQILTKRPARMLEWFRWLDVSNSFGFPTQVDPLKVWPQWTPASGGRGGYDNCGPAWPLESVWLGVSVEDRRRYQERVPLLRQTPAALRWISAEPLLEDLGDIDFTGIDWVVVGGESGPGARPMHPEWARSLRDQCAAGGVPFFFKQWGAWKPIGNMYDNTIDEEITLDWDKEGGVTAELLSTNGTRWGQETAQPPTDTWFLQRVGKKVAGRILDGRIYDEYPA